VTASPGDPFGYISQAAQEEAEDREAEALLAVMAGNGNAYLRDAIARKRDAIARKRVLPTEKEDPGQKEGPPSGEGPPAA
jgi:hypothetical protein